MNRILANIRQKFWKAGVTASVFLKNLTSRQPVNGGKGVVVSLTSYGRRARRNVFLTIESIAQGTHRPERVILWLDEEDLLRKPPAGLRRLQKRGLEIRRCEDMGPHKKYYPYILENPDCTAHLVTADDDMLYPAEWLSLLVDSAEQHPDNVISLRARAISVTHNEADGEPQLAAYSTWLRRESSEAGALVFPTGTSGVLYPKVVQDALREAGDGSTGPFRFVDDVWLHSKTIEAGFVARQAFDRAIDYPMQFLSQGNALFRRNVTNNENDEQVMLAYPPELVRLIAKSVDS